MGIGGGGRIRARVCLTFDGFDVTDSVFQAFVWGISGDSWARIRYSVPLASFQSNLSLSL